MAAAAADAIWAPTRQGSAHHSKQVIVVGLHASMARGAFHPIGWGKSAKDGELCRTCCALAGLGSSSPQLSTRREGKGGKST